MASIVMNVSETTPIIRSYTDCMINDGKIAIVIGKYTIIPEPTKGIAQVNTHKKYAVIVLNDGTHVFLEPMNSPQSIRSETEYEEFKGKCVLVFGTINRIMPSLGESLINPCISQVVSIQECEKEDTIR
jgi:hypothetical protein